MGTGKSSVGKELSKIRGKTFVDTDDEIIKQHGPIEKIFVDHGEEYFRECERLIVRQVASLSDVVIATGGGVVIDPRNVEVLSDSGEIFCLVATPQEIIERLTRNKGIKTRPLLNSRNPLDTISELLADRQNIYGQFAQFETGGKSPFEIALKINDVIINKT
jgi:shikimate kinase